MEGIYIKSLNEIFARHLLAMRRQQPGESLDKFLQSLRKLSKDCNLKAVSAERYRKNFYAILSSTDSTHHSYASVCWRIKLSLSKWLMTKRIIRLGTENAESYSMSGGVVHAAAITCKHAMVDSADQTQSQPPSLAAVIHFFKFCGCCVESTHYLDPCLLG